MHGLLSACDFVIKCMTLILNFAFSYSHSRFTSYMKSLSNPRLSKCNNTDLLYRLQFAFIPDSSVLVCAKNDNAFTWWKLNLIILCDLTEFENLTTRSSQLGNPLPLDSNTHVGGRERGWVCLHTLCHCIQYFTGIHPFFLHQSHTWFNLKLN
jgi:hypothetical protein